MGFRVLTWKTGRIKDAFNCIKEARRKNKFWGKDRNSFWTCLV